MKKGCLTIFVTLSILITFIFGYIVLFPEKPASEETKKQILLAEYSQIKNTDDLTQKLEILDFLEKNKSTIIDSLKVINSENYFFLDLDNYSNKTPSLPIKLLNELSNINTNKRITYQLKITKSNFFSLINTTTDYKNYLYIIHELSKIDTLIDNNDAIEKFTKIKLINDDFQYKITIKDAFNDIDPNNFAPN